MNYKKYIFLIMFAAVANLTYAQVTTAQLWVNEFHYDAQSLQTGSAENEFVELIISNELLNNPTELAKYELVLYASNGFDLSTDDELPGKGLPYSKSSGLFSDAETFHNLAVEDADGNTGFQRCAVEGRNYSVMSKNLSALQDLPSAFAIIYNETTVVQLISYEGEFKIQDSPEAGAAAGMPTQEIMVSEGGMTDDSHSIQMRGTGNSYEDFTWMDNDNFTASKCSVNASQTINDLPAADALPVALMNFSAQATQNTIVVNWNTASEIDNKGFFLERSVATSNKFSDLTFVAARGNSTQTIAYKWIDEEVEAGKIYFYRLRQVDVNGAITYSSVVAARIKGKQVAMNLTPNPAQDHVSIQLNDVKTASVLKITSINGQTLQQQTIDPSDSQTLEVNLANYASGIYFLRLENSEGVMVKRLSVQ